MTSGLGRRQVGRVTIDERPGALIVTAPFLSRSRAAVLTAGVVACFALLGAFAFGASGARRTADVAGTIAVFGGCGYLALILALNKTITTVRGDSNAVRYGPLPAWPAKTVDSALVEDVRASIRTGVTRFGGRIALDEITASLAGGRSVTLVDDAGSTADAEQVAATITTWLWSHRT
jgi:phage baseplate assembly protein W